MNKLNTIKFYTYKQLLYILIKLNIITSNQKNELLIDYYETLQMWISLQLWTVHLCGISTNVKYQLNKSITFTI